MLLICVLRLRAAEAYVSLLSSLPSRLIKCFRALQKLREVVFVCVLDGSRGSSIEGCYRPTWGQEPCKAGCRGHTQLTSSQVCDCRACSRMLCRPIDEEVISLPALILSYPELGPPPTTRRKRIAPHNTRLKKGASPLQSCSNRPPS